MQGFDVRTACVLATLFASTFPAAPAWAQGERSGSSNQTLSTIVIGVFTLVTTLLVMYLLARGRRHSEDED